MWRKIVYFRGLPNNRLWLYSLILLSGDLIIARPEEIIKLTTTVIAREDNTIQPTTTKEKHGITRYLTTTFPEKNCIVPDDWLYPLCAYKVEVNQQHKIEKKMKDNAITLMVLCRRRDLAPPVPAPTPPTA